MKKWTLWTLWTLWMLWTVLALGATVDRGTAWLVNGNGSFSESAAGFKLRSAHVVGASGAATATIYQASAGGVSSLGTVALDATGSGWLNPSGDLYTLNNGGISTFAVQAAGTNAGACLFTVLTVPVSRDRISFSGGTGMVFAVSTGYRLNSVIYSNVTPANVTGSLFAVTGGIVTNLLSTNIIITAGVGTYTETNTAAYYVVPDYFNTTAGTGSATVATFVGIPP